MTPDMRKQEMANGFAHGTGNRNVLSEERLQNALRNLPRRNPPAGLTTSLRVLASREVQRRNSPDGGRLAAWLDRTRLALDNLMRPVALPAAGGVFSAFALFAMFVVPTYPLRARGTYDVPTMLSTEATIKGTAPLSVVNGDVFVDVSVDGQGRMIDYAIVGGAGVLVDPTLRRRIENVLLFTEFVPATSFGMPTAGKMRISMHSSWIEVKG
jgi:hypothetical protein